MKFGFIAIILAVGGNHVVSTPPYVVYETLKACEHDAVRLRAGAPLVVVVCRPGSIDGPAERP